MIITGIPVATAKTIGRYKPEALPMLMGINIPKYSTPLYGQNARAFWIATLGTHTYVGRWPIDDGSDTCTFTVVE